MMNAREIEEKEKLISFIIPVYNGELFVARAVKSILSIASENFEVIIVNDGSIDETEKICHEFECLHSNVKLINSENNGVSHARNQGISESAGRYIWFCDADDEINSKNYLDIENILISKKPFLLCFDSCHIDENGRVISIKSNSSGELSVLKKNYGIEKLISIDCKFGVCDKIYISELIKKNGVRFDESVKHLEDLKFNIDFLCKVGSNDKIIYYQYPMYLYRESTMSVTRSAFKLEKLDTFKVIKYSIEKLMQVDLDLSGPLSIYSCNRVLGYFSETNSKLYKNELKKEYIESIRTVFRSGVKTKRKVRLMMLMPFVFLKSGE